MSNTSKEIITINVGGCGNNLGQHTLEQSCVEHGISKSAETEFKTDCDHSLSTTFHEKSSGNYVSRSLFVDLSPESACMIQNFYPYKDVINPTYILSGTSDGASNHARGHYTHGKELIDQVNNALRLMTEEADNVQGFIFQGSMSGGTGGGMGALILERVAVDYRKKPVHGFHTFLDKQKGHAPTQIYNTVWNIHWLMDHTDTSMIIDNAQLRELCRNKLRIRTPRYRHMNSLSSKVITNITAPWRFGLKQNMRAFSQDLVPFPRLHFMTMSLGDIQPKIGGKNMDINTLVRQSVDPKHFMMGYDGIKLGKDMIINTRSYPGDKYMAMMFNVRGIGIDGDRFEMQKCMKSLNDNDKTKFIEWCNDAAMVNHINASNVELPNDDIYNGDKQVVMIGNYTAIGRKFAVLQKEYELLYSQRSWTHWLWGEGCESGEFAECGEDLGFLGMDFLDVLTPQVTDEYDDESD